MSGDFLLQYIMTTEQKNDLINLLEQLLEDIFKRDTRPTPKSPFEKKTLELIYLEIENKKIGNDSMEMEKFLKSLLEETRALPELKLTIAVYPTEELIEKLKDWAKSYKITNMVFDIDVNPEIIAGAIIISTEGKYVKYSLSEMLDNYFISKKQELTQLL